MSVALSPLPELFLVYFLGDFGSRYRQSETPPLTALVLIPKRAASSLMKLSVGDTKGTLELF